MDKHVSLQRVYICIALFYLYMFGKSTNCKLVIKLLNISNSIFLQFDALSLTSTRLYTLKTFGLFLSLLFGWKSPTKPSNNITVKFAREHNCKLCSIHCYHSNSWTCVKTAWISKIVTITNYNFLYHYTPKILRK